MTRVLSLSRSHPHILWPTAIATLAALLLTCSQSAAVSVAQEKALAGAPRAVDEGATSDRVIVSPEPSWGGWGDWHDGWNEGGPRVDVWVDRGDWSVYRPGDRLRVYFRVDRPCYVTIVDYTSDGGTSIVYPNRWSGSNFVHPGRTYRIPASREYSLRVAGPGGEETLYACAHSAPWPSVSGGYWLPPYPPHRGRVVVGRPGGGMPPGRHGRVVVGPGSWWPVPPAWHDRRDRWGCDSVTFHVESGYPWSHHGSGWRDEYVDPDHYYGHHRYDDGVVFREGFRMTDCSDRYQRSLGRYGYPLTVVVECIESRRGGPTEIVGRIVWEDGWGREEMMRLDVEGSHGDRPVEGRAYLAATGDARIEIAINKLELSDPKPWQLLSIESIEFDVRVVFD